MKQKWVKWNVRLYLLLLPLSHPFSSIFFCCTDLLHILLHHLHDSSMWSFSFISCLAAWSLSSYSPIYQSAHVQTISSLPLLRCLPIIAELTTICFTLAAILLSQIPPDTQLHPQHSICTLTFTLCTVHCSGCLTQPRGVAQTNVLLVPAPCLDKWGGLHQWGHPA